MASTYGPLPLDDDERPKAGDPPGEARAVYDPHDIPDVLVGEGSLFAEGPALLRAHDHPLGPQLFLERWHVDAAFCLAAALLPARAVARRAKGLLHSAFRPHEHERAAPHVPGDQHGLPGRPVGLRELRVAGRERPRGAPPVDANPLAPSPDLVRLELGHVVRDVVDEAEADVARPAAEETLERLPD